MSRIGFRFLAVLYTCLSCTLHRLSCVVQQFCSRPIYLPFRSLLTSSEVPPPPLRALALPRLAPAAGHLAHVVLASSFSPVALHHNSRPVLTMDAGTSGAGDYGGGGDSEGIREVLGGGGDNEDGGGGDDNSSDVYVDEESRNSREGIMLSLAAMGKHLESMMATQGLLLATSQNLQERIRMRKRRRSGGSSSEEEPRSGTGNSAAGQRAIYQPREPTGLYTTACGDADPRTFYRYVHFTREEFDELVEFFRAAIEEVLDPRLQMDIIEISMKKPRERKLRTEEQLFLYLTALWAVMKVESGT
jgi:hypothetical protein